MKEGDRRRFNGGNKTAGRKGKDEEQKVIEKLKPLDPIAYEGLEKAMRLGQSWAIKLFFEYMYGKPKERKDITTNGESLNIPKIEFFESKD